MGQLVFSEELPKMVSVKDDNIQFLQTHKKFGRISKRINYKIADFINQYEVSYFNKKYAY